MLQLLYLAVPFQYAFAVYHSGSSILSGSRGVLIALF